MEPVTVSKPELVPAKEPETATKPELVHVMEPETEPAYATVLETATNSSPQNISNP